MDKTKDTDFQGEKEVMIADQPETFQIFSVIADGHKYRTTITKKFAARKIWTPPNPEEIRSFIPGTIEKILVRKGQDVKSNDALIVYVAMKMRNIIRAPFEGKVTAVLVKEGSLLPKGAPLLILKQKPSAKIKKDIREEARARREKARQEKREKSGKK
jgi:pyruvate carboxylase